MSKTGKCLCGAISYQVIGTPAHSALCWCERCRASARATPVGWALFADDAVTISGSPVRYDSSPATYHESCATCRTGLFDRSEAVFPGQVDIQIATLEYPDGLPPQAHIQVADAPAWLDRHSELPRFARFPGGPA